MSPVDPPEDETPDEPDETPKPSKEVEPIDLSQFLEHADAVDPNPKEVLRFIGEHVEPPNPLAGIDFGKIMPTINFADYMPKLDTAIFDAIKDIDFGYAGLLDAAVLKSLANLPTPEPIFPPGFFDKFLDFKFPELNLYPAALLKIEELAVPPVSRELEPLDSEIIEAELVEDESPKSIAPVASPSLIEQQVALQKRTVELLEQSIESNAEANRQNAAERENTRKANRLNVILVIAGLVLAIVGIVVGVLVAG